jgi:hypothetical protein
MSGILGELPAALSEAVAQWQHLLSERDRGVLAQQQQQQQQQAQLVVLHNETMGGVLRSEEGGGDDAQKRLQKEVAGGRGGGKVGGAGEVQGSLSVRFEESFGKKTGKGVWHNYFIFGTRVFFF